MKYKIGQSAKVKKGILCPDDPDYDLSGWQGRIIDIVEEEVDEPTIGITWDSITLEEMPKTYIEKSEKEGLSWSDIYLDVNDVEPTQPRDSEDDVVQIRGELEARFGWISMGAEGELIQGVVNSAKSLDDWDVMKAWKKHFQKFLQFPFETVIERQQRSPLNEGDKLKVFGIELVDDHHGIIVSCMKGPERYDFPLVDLKIIEDDSINAHQVQAYCTWFANRH